MDANGDFHSVARPSMDLKSGGKVLSALTLHY